jgi:lipopolysaccharide/colanic/teichoic acid biosynthesis glycosyltransferase
MNAQKHQALNAKFLFSPKMVRIPTWKRVVDLGLCIIALPLFGLVCAVMAVVLKIVSPGPVLFVQERVGYRGSRFMCYKFRTMIMGADTRSHQEHVDHLLSSKEAMVKLDEKGDSRMIPGSWILRTTGLDELPQILNVLKGDMCIVGPRPCLPYEFERYQPCQRARFNSMPGITGLWQVSGKNRTTFDEMIKLDVSYSEKRALSLDLWIIAMTIPALLVQVSDMFRARKPAGHAEESLAGHAGKTGGAPSLQPASR